MLVNQTHTNYNQKRTWNIHIRKLNTNPMLAKTFRKHLPSRSNINQLSSKTNYKAIIVNSSVTQLTSEIEYTSIINKQANLQINYNKNKIKLITTTTKHK